MTEIPTEVLEAAARAIAEANGNAWLFGGRFSHVESAREIYRQHARAAAPYLIAEGRRQGIAQVFAPKADQFTVALDDEGLYVDETPALMARYERELRAKIAAEIRRQAANVVARAMVVAEVGPDVSADHPFALGCEWAARIAEADNG